MALALVTDQKKNAYARPARVGAQSSVALARLAFSPPLTRAALRMATKKEKQEKTLPRLLTEEIRSGRREAYALPA